MNPEHEISEHDDDMTVDETALHIVRDHEVPSYVVAASAVNPHDIHSQLHVLREADRKRRARMSRRYARAQEARRGLAEK